jgi:hypothetical protein
MQANIFHPQTLITLSERLTNWAPSFRRSGHCNQCQFTQTMGLQIGISYAIRQGPHVICLRTKRAQWAAHQPEPGCQVGRNNIGADQRVIVLSCQRSITLGTVPLNADAFHITWPMNYCFTKWRTSGSCTNRAYIKWHANRWQVIIQPRCEA